MIGAAREDIDLDNDGVASAQGDVNVGAVYIYERTGAGPVFHSKIVGEGNTKNVAGDRFGAGIALQGDVMFVGAANALPPYSFAGQVYVFNHDAGLDEWVLVQKLTSDDPNDSGSFGSRTDSSHMELFSFGDDQPEPTIALIGEVENLGGLPPTLHVFKREEDSNQWNRVQIADSPSGFHRHPFRRQGGGRWQIRVSHRIRV